MRTPDYTAGFNRDYKREKKGRHGAHLDASLQAVLPLLLADLPLHESFRDHPMRGKWAGHRDCHVKPDLVLIYQKVDSDRLRLVRLGSHSELKI